MPGPYPRAASPFSARSRVATPTQFNNATSASISISAEEEYPFASHLVTSPDSPRSSLYGHPRQSSLSKERPQYKGSYVSAEEPNSTASVLRKQQRNALVSNHQKYVTSSYSHPSSLAHSRNFAVASNWGISSSRSLGGEHLMDYPSRSHRSMSPSPSRLSMHSNRPGRDPSSYYPTPPHDVIPNDRGFDTYLPPLPLRATATSVAPRSFSAPSRGIVGGRRGIGIRGPSHLNNKFVAVDKGRSYSSMDYNNVPFDGGGGDIDSDEYAEGDPYDSDEGVARRAHPLPTPSPGPITRFSPTRSLMNDLGVGAGTLAPSSPPEHDEQPTASYLTASPLMDTANEETNQQTTSLLQSRPPPSRELSRGTLFPRTPANRPFPPGQYPRVPVAHLPVPPSPSSTSHSTDSEQGIRGPMFNMPGLDIREKDDPFKEIILEDEDQRGRPKHARKGGQSSSRKKKGGSYDKGLKSEKIGANREKSTVRQGRVWHEEIVEADSTMPNTPLSTMTRARAGLSFVGEDGSYIPSHHGKNKSLRLGAAPFGHDEYTPSCTDGLRRSWQSFKISLRFGMFRTRKRLKKSAGLS
ncbi:uncharacterized protein EI90DRAFT_1977267 [Cantharellus anzutake]|uniref:uncharacterized protein n=1 Tax=Cantharellus anzutake TaxID=1750568 RepID=UPI001906815F|nr:uncharacterized protein EI90DRAFT_1977267 [Cantharellus anzutake]KAF8325989.1 hypothetical protein EI90DRAFT_1977267 [Cantharellus anzutake]